MSSESRGVYRTSPATVNSHSTVRVVGDAWSPFRLGFFVAELAKSFGNELRTWGVFMLEAFLPLAGGRGAHLRNWGAEKNFDFDEVTVKSIACNTFGGI
jgi:hypothetical protein